MGPFGSRTDHVPVVLFDSGLGSLRLPILKPVLSLVQTDDEPVDTLVEKYFETCISVEDMSCACKLQHST